MKILVQPLLTFPATGDGGRMESLIAFNRPRRKEKVVFVMGATGTGKSKLSIDLATRFPAEIINSDKMQVYKGLDIVTNKVSQEEQRLVPHHLLGFADSDSDFAASDFRVAARAAIQSVVERGKLPIVAGGSNSFVEALVEDKGLRFRSRYECRFLWVDVSLPILHSFVSDRVDRMVEAGLVSEVREIFDPDADYSRGIKQAIGVPEMDRYFRAEADPSSRARLLDAAIDEIKANTCKLSCCQLEKIHRLRRRFGWDIRRFDATDVLRKTGPEAEEAWETLVCGPASVVVREFLMDGGDDGKLVVPARSWPATATAMAGARAGAGY